MKNKVFKAFCKVPMNLQLFAEGDGAGTGDEGGNGGGADRPDFVFFQQAARLCGVGQ